MTDGSVASPRRAVLPVWLIATVAGVFGLLYAYVVWNAVAFLVVQASGSVGLNGLGWFVMLFAVLFPIVVFAAAFALGWRRSIGPFALIMLSGLALVAVFWLNVLAYAYSYGVQLLG